MIDPPDTPLTKSTWSRSDRLRVELGTCVSSKPVSTPYEKAAARVPPPEKDKATTVSS